MNTKKADMLFPVSENVLSSYTGEKLYEMTNHLGNVLTVINDIKVPYQSGTDILYYATITNTSDYSPFGVTLDVDGGRTQYLNPNIKYRFRFQGQEMDDEIKGEGNSVNYTYRIHDPRLGRFFAIDPLVADYPMYSPYHFSSNQPIHAHELEGLESANDLNANYNLHVNRMGSAFQPPGLYKPRITNGLLGSSISCVHGNQIPYRLSDQTLENIVTGGAIGIAVALVIADVYITGGQVSFYSSLAYGISCIGQNMNDTERYYKAKDSGDPVRIAQTRADMRASGSGVLFALGPVAGRAFSYGAAYVSSLRAAPLGYTINQINASAGSFRLGVAGNTSVSLYMPANNGFLGTSTSTFLMPGQVISRYGSNAGKYFAPSGTPRAMRALSPSSTSSYERTFKVLKPFEVQTGTTAPAFGETGLGIQYYSPVSLETLIKRKIIAPTN